MAQENPDDADQAPPYRDTVLPADAASTVRHVVLSYLVYHCNEEAAKSFAAAIAYDLGTDGAAPTPQTAATTPLKAKTTAYRPVHTLAAEATAGATTTKNSVVGSDDNIMMEVDEVATDGPAMHARQSVPHPQVSKLADHGLVAMGQTMAARKQLMDLLLKGKVDAALEHCQQHFPGVVADINRADFMQFYSASSATRGTGSKRASANDLSPVDSIVSGGGSSTSNHSLASVVAGPDSSSQSAASSSLQPAVNLSCAGALDPLSVAFQLHCLHFIELVRRDNQSAALQYAQQVLGKFGVVRPRLLGTLRDVVALIAYQDPQTSPVGDLLSLEQRSLVADAVNSAILAHRGLAPKSALEMLVRQVAVVRDTLTAELAGKEKKAMIKAGAV